jgi:O-antigen/teichoic acid export membrane protein
VRQRAITAASSWTATAFGFLATVVAARELGLRGFGLFALVVATTGFVQLLLDSTVEEATIKYGFRYHERRDWGRLRRLFAVALRVKLAGGLVAAAVLAALAPLADAVFDEQSLTVPLLVGAALPLVQAPEAVCGATIIVRGRYDVRAMFMVLAMALRFAGVAVGAGFGVTAAVTGMVAAQVIATLAIAAAAVLWFREVPAAPRTVLGEDRNPIRRFVALSAVGSGLMSARTTLGVLLLGVVTNAAQVAYFRAAQLTQTGFAALSAPARLALFAEQTRDVEGGRHGRAYGLLGRYMTATTLLMVLVVPPAWIFMPDILRLVYGSDFVPGTEAARWILLAAALQFVWGWTKTFGVSIGRPGLRIVAHSVELAVMIPLLVILGRSDGAAGAAVAVLVATAVFALIWTVMVLRVRDEPGEPGAEAL